jgi:ABC-type Fe3+-hydroxamate transport system substrate-binding protein
VRLRILIAIALVGALGGCQESGFDESKETQRPLKVQDAMNPLEGTKVPGRAERPATLTADTLGDTIALGVTPVVASDVPDYMRADARGVRVVEDGDLDGIRAATPDVILGTKDGQGDEYRDLSKIAPTIITDEDDWKLNLREHGEALGRTNDAEELLTRYDDQVAKVKRMLGEGKTMIRLTGDPEIGEIALDPDTAGGQTFADLGVKPYEPFKHGYRVIDVTGGAEWIDGGILGARARLADIAGAL